MHRKFSMIINCNIWMTYLELNWFFYDPSWMLQLSEFVWMQRSSVWVVFNNFLLIDATDRSKISCYQKRLFFALSLYSLSFFLYGPFKLKFYKMKKGQRSRKLLWLVKVSVLKKSSSIIEIYIIKLFVHLYVCYGWLNGWIKWAEFLWGNSRISVGMT